MTHCTLPQQVLVYFDNRSKVAFSSHINLQFFLNYRSVFIVICLMLMRAVRFVVFMQAKQLRDTQRKKAIYK